MPAPGPIGLSTAGLTLGIISLVVPFVAGLVLPLIVGVLGFTLSCVGRTKDKGTGTVAGR